MAGTEKTAESVEWHLPEMACSEPSQLIIVGFWTWRGGADPAMKSYLSTLHGRRVFAFGTMAAWPDLKHIDQCRKSLLEVLKPGGNILEGTFFCQGRLDPKIRAGSRHPMTPERLCRLNEAEKHPNLADMQAAERAVRLVLTRLFHA